MTGGLGWLPRSQKDNMPDDSSFSWNSDRPWSEIDNNDLAWHLNDRQSLTKIADFLFRTREEVAARIEALGLPKPAIP
jgi:hypothetical protein